MRSSRAPCGDRGTVTAELATCLPVLVLLLGVMLSAVSVAGTRVRVQDAAREAARAAARGDHANARSLAQRYAPGVSVRLSTSGAQVTADARLREHLIASWLPAVTVTGSAVAALEPSTVPAAQPHTGVPP
jgi:Flp pilus assembly protein TadG